MNKWQLVGALSVASAPLFGMAEESQTQDLKKTVPNVPEAAEITEIPTDEQGFVKTIGKLDKSKIVALLGEPAKADDVKLKDSGRIVASIWHYHYINTNSEGEYYQTTELDFVDGKVNVVVFLNNDGSDNSEGKTYDLPPGMPTM